jgi:hypothetical protein
MSTMQRCAACRRLFRVRAQVRGQRYCTARACQRVRRKRWQRTKRRTDPDYRENRARAQEAWRIRHPGYWRAYRATHARYTEANRAQQARRDAARRLAKMDVSTAFSPGISGIYRLSAVDCGDLAKSDAWTVELTVLSRA